MKTTLKDYLYSLRFFVLFCFLFFVFSGILGYFSAKFNPEQAQQLLEQMKEMYGLALQANVFGQFLFVFLNNGFTLFLVLVLGVIFGIFPLLVLFANGAVFGVLGFFAKDTISWSKFFLGTLPHGIIEIPVIILACAIGLKIGKAFLKSITEKQGNTKKEFFSALKFFLKILLPLLALSAAIEIFITAKLLGV